MHGSLIPSLCYDDARAAIRWLEEAFGFRPHLVVPGPNDSVRHSQLVCDEPPCMVMVFSTRDDEFGSLQRSPKTLGAVNAGLYMIVADVRAHHAKAAAAGAEIMLAPTSQDYGGECYTCRDPEGHVWSFGDYDPGAEI